MGTPSRENCGVCHNYGGGGQGVKHGDLDSSLDNPSEEDDVHMGRLGMLCVDCHRTTEHRIPGRSFSVSVEGANGVACTDCHAGPPHSDERLNAHLHSVACQTCHIPTYARKLPTKAFWDWSRAGDSTRVEDPHHYLKIKGEFLYDQDVTPEYLWFDRSVDRYLLGDRIDTTRVTDLNRPHGGIGEAEARIWPFKIHRALQPYDRTNAILLTPITGGAGGYWKTFDWDTSLRLGARAAAIPYSGDYGFTRTATYWPLSHMVTPKERALTCNDCHGEGGRMDWAALGYCGRSDPALEAGDEDASQDRDVGGRDARRRVGIGGCGPRARTRRGRSTESPARSGANRGSESHASDLRPARFRRDTGRDLRARGFLGTHVRRMPRRGVDPRPQRSLDGVRARGMRRRATSMGDGFRWILRPTTRTGSFVGKLCG